MLITNLQTLEFAYSTLLNPRILKLNLNVPLQLNRGRKNTVLKAGK